MKELVLLLLLGLTQGLELTPPVNVWGRVGERNVSLLCSASDRIRSCSWATPYGKVYPLESGLMAEGGRLVHHVTEDRDKQCGVIITTLEEKDQGKWRCNVGVVEDSEVTTASGMATISLATPPSRLTFSEDFSGDTTNVTEGEEYKVTCVAVDTQPAPVFSWSLDGHPLTPSNPSKTQPSNPLSPGEPPHPRAPTPSPASHSHTLVYRPSLRDSNHSLACSISHPGLKEPMVIATKIQVTSLPVSAASLPTGAVVGIVVALLFTFLVIGLIVIFSKTRASEDITEVEAVQEKTDEEKEGKEKADEEKAEKVDFRVKISAFLTGAFRDKEGKVGGDLSMAASEWEKVDLSDTKEEEKGGEGKKEENGKVAAFLAKLRGRQGKEEEEEKEIEEGEEEEKEVVSAVEGEKLVNRGKGTPV